jgi:hypothetical protein
MTRMEQMLALGLASLLALSTATPSFGQTQQRQRPAAQQQQGPGTGQQDETFGQAAPRGQSRGGGAQQGQCWIPTNEDQGMGYWGDCSGGKGRQFK